MDHCSDVMIAFEMGEWEENILPELREHYDIDDELESLHCTKIQHYTEPDDEVEYIIFYWENYKHWNDEYHPADISDTLNELALNYPSDYFAVSGGWHVAAARMRLGILEIQTLRPLFPDEPWLEESWRQNEALKADFANAQKEIAALTEILRKEYGMSDQDIETSVAKYHKQ